MDTPENDPIERYRKRSEEKLRIFVVFAIAFFFFMLWFLLSE
jgi:hypothetical protein